MSAGHTKMHSSNAPSVPKILQPAIWKVAPVFPSEIFKKVPNYRDTITWPTLLRNAALFDYYSCVFPSLIPSQNQSRSVSQGQSTTGSANLVLAFHHAGEEDVDVERGGKGGPSSLEMLHTPASVSAMLPPISHQPLAWRLMELPSPAGRQRRLRSLGQLHPKEHHNVRSTKMHATTAKIQNICYLRLRMRPRPGARFPLSIIPCYCHPRFHAFVQALQPQISCIICARDLLQITANN